MTWVLKAFDKATDERVLMLRLPSMSDADARRIIDPDVATDIEDTYPLTRIRVKRLAKFMSSDGLLLLRRHYDVFFQRQ